MKPSRRAVGIAAAIALVAALALLWSSRWLIGGGTVRIVDPAVRRWAAGEVLRLSDSVYRVNLSTLHVDADRHRITIDTITLRTDEAINTTRNQPLPIVTLQLRSCALEEIDLARLAAGEGLHVGTVGCDSALVEVTVPERHSGGPGPEGQLLSLRDTLGLPSTVPLFLIDSVRFPSVRLALHIADPVRRTDLVLDQLLVSLDSVSYDPADSTARYRPLLSRNVTVHLEAFRGNREGTDHLALDLLEGDLVAGNLRLRGLAWKPAAGPHADSLGLDQLAVDSLDMTGIDWRAFLTRGDVRVQTVQSTGLAITTRPTSARAGPAGGNGPDGWTMAGAIDALDRSVRVDTFSATGTRIVHQARTGGTAQTTAAMVRLTGLRAGQSVDGGEARSQVGPLRLVASDVTHQWQDYRAHLDTLVLDLAAGHALVRGLRYAPEGTDGDFARRRRWRTDRITASLQALRLEGLDARALMDHGWWRIAAMQLDGLRLDLLSDKRMPVAPNPPRHRTPQAWLRDAPLLVRIDTIAVKGEITYRERNAETGIIGTIHFTGLTGSLANFATRPPRGAPPIRFLATARLNDMAPLQVQVSLPPASRGLDLHWQGRLGAMPAAGLNPLLVAVGDATFKEGRIDYVTFEADTRAGLSSGTARPRYHDLSVSLPGVGRSGLLGGVRRAIAGAVANTFVIREDNLDTGGSPPADGTILHGWSPSETLIQHLWTSLRSALLEVLKS